MKILILRPQPGAAATAEKLASLGLEPVVAPLFDIRPLDWQAPDPRSFDAILFTSANAPRNGGPQLAAFHRHRCFAVGEATAAAARAAGFEDVRSGCGDGAALMAVVAEAGVGRALHLCGRDHVALRHPVVEVAARPVYSANAADRLPPSAVAAIEEGAVALLHSARAADLFGTLVDSAAIERSRLTIVTISRQVAEAAGAGWASKASAARPCDEALLELAAKLCQNIDMGAAG